MIKEVLKILKNRPSNAPDLIYPKYESVFQNTELLSEIMKWKWNEETYKRLRFLFYLMTKEPKELGDNSKFLSIYDSFFYYILHWFLSKFEKLPFESWSHLGKEGFDLLKVLFKENQLETYKKDKRYIEIHGKCEKQLKAILKDEKVLSVLLNFREGWEQYEGLYCLSYLIQRNSDYIENNPGAEFFKKKDVLPIYIDVQRYIYDWRKLYGIAIVFKDWEDLRTEGIDLLKQFIHENRLNEFKEDTRYKEFFKKISACYNELLKRDYKKINKLLRTGNTALKSNKELQKFIDILDQEEKLNLSFFDQYGRGILKDVRLLLALINEKWDHQKKKYLRLASLSRIIFCAIRATYSGDRKTSGILPIYECFQKYMYAGCSFLGNRSIPFKDWEDLAKEEDDLLKVLIKDHKLDQFRGDPRYIYWLQDRFSDRIDELIKKGYTDLQVMEVPSGL